MPTVTERAKTLHEDGYTCVLVADSLFQIVNRDGTGKYYVDPKARTCTCKYFEINRGCKHLIGIKALVRATAADLVKRGEGWSTEAKEMLKGIGE